MKDIDINKLFDPDRLNTPDANVIAAAKMGGRTVVNELLLNTLLSGSPVTGDFVTSEEWKSFVPNPYAGLEGLTTKYVDALFDAFYQGAKARWDEAVILSKQRQDTVASIFSKHKSVVS